MECAFGGERLREGEYVREKRERRAELEKRHQPIKTEKITGRI